MIAQMVEERILRVVLREARHVDQFIETDEVGVVLDKSLCLVLLQLREISNRRKKGLLKAFPFFAKWRLRVVMTLVLPLQLSAPVRCNLAANPRGTETLKTTGGSPAKDPSRLYGAGLCFGFISFLP